MRRPLACAGFTYLIVQLLAAFLPPAALGPLAALFLLAAAGAVLCRRKLGRAKMPALLLCAVASAAFAARWMFWAGVVQPVLARAGQEADVVAAVEAAAPGFAEDTVRATVRVEQVDGMRVRPFRVNFFALPQLRAGERFSARVSFEPLAQNEYLLSNNADGVFLSGEYLSGFARQGESSSLAARARRMQEILSDALRSVLARPYAGVAAAMAVGDRTFLEETVTTVFRRAGLSHTLVVSGLHLSAVSALVCLGLRRIVRRRAAAAGAMAATLLFMMLTGLTPSVVRAGVMMLVLYTGLLVWRKSDALTSLGAAALLLCMQNPYAAVDAGLLLSFSSTLAVLWVNEARRRAAQRDERNMYPKRPAPPKTAQAADARAGEWRARAARFLERLGWAAAVPLACSFAALPVLVAIGGGVSLLSVLCNLLTVPFLPVVVGSGLLAAVCACAPGLGFLARLAGLICSLVLRWVMAVAQWAAAVPYAFVHVTGLFAMCVTLLLCALLFSAWKLRVPGRRAAVLCAVFLCASVGVYAAADANIVRVVVAGSGQNPSLVVLQGLRTAVVFRGPRTNVEAVQNCLARYNRSGVELLIDLRAEGDAAALAGELGAREYLSAQEDIINNAVCAPFRDMIIYVKHQNEGNFACVELCGFRVGISSGSVELSGYPPFDIYVAGSGRPEGLRCTQLLLPRTSYRWLDDLPAAQIVRSAGTPVIAVRAGTSVSIEGVRDGIE